MNDSRRPEDSSSAGDGVDEALASLTDAVRATMRLLHLRFWSVRATARRLAAGAVFGAGALLIVASLSVAASVAIVRGVTSGLARLLGEPWAGDLVGGSLLLAALATAGWWAWRRADRRFRARAETALGASPGTEPTTEASDRGEAA